MPRWRSKRSERRGARGVTRGTRLAAGLRLPRHTNCINRRRVDGLRRRRYDAGMAGLPGLTTAQELSETPNLGRCELVRGELVMMAPAGYEHGAIAGRVHGHLFSYVTQRGLGIVTAAETGFRIGHDPDTVRAPTSGSSAPPVCRASGRAVIFRARSGLCRRGDPVFARPRRVFRRGGPPGGRGQGRPGSVRLRLVPVDRAR